MKEACTGCSASIKNRKSMKSGSAVCFGKSEDWFYYSLMSESVHLCDLMEMN